MDAEVIVIGGGMAGLAAARKLAAAGRRTTLIEARPRLGGRIMTRRLPHFDAPVELGAEFVHGEAAEVVALAREAHAPLVEVSRSQWTSRDTHLMHVNGAWDAALRSLREQPELDVSVAEHLATQVANGRLGPSAAKLARRYVEGFYAAHAARVSASAVARFEATSSLRLRRVHGGYDLLVRHLEYELTQNPRVRLLTGTAARSVLWSQRGVTIETLLGERLVGDAAVITVSIGALSSPFGLSFVPALPQWKRRAIDAFAMGPVAKVVLALTEPLALPREYDGGFFHAQGPNALPTLWPASTSMRSFAAWAGGDQVEALAAHSRPRLFHVASAALAELAARPHTEVLAKIVGYATHDWSADPTVRGAYAYVLAGREANAMHLDEPLLNTLYFAGEATHAHDPGTVSGAIASGQRAASQVLQYLLTRPPRSPRRTPPAPP